MILHKFARIMSKQRFSVEESKNTPRWPTFKKKYPLTRPFPRQCPRKHRRYRRRPVCSTWAMGMGPATLPAERRSPLREVQQRTVRCAPSASSREAVALAVCVLLSAKGEHRPIIIMCSEAVAISTSFNEKGRLLLPTHLLNSVALASIGLRIRGTACSYLAGVIPRSDRAYFISGWAVQQAGPSPGRL